MQFTFVDDPDGVEEGDELLEADVDVLLREHPQPGGQFSPVLPANTHNLF